jgi:hypothetical protein
MALPSRLVVIVTLSVLAACGHAQAGLEGQSLVRISEELGHDDDQPLRGAISRIVVLRDTDRELLLKVEYRGLNGGKLDAAVQTIHLEPVPRISRPSAIVPTGPEDEPRSVELSLMLGEDAPEGFSGTSGRVTIEVAHASRPTFQFRQHFSVAKTWRARIAPENVVVRVVPQPVGMTRDFLQNLGHPTSNDSTETGGILGSTCAGAIQGRIAWDYRGTTRWDPGNLSKLCRGAEDSRAPGACFQRVMHGGVNWGSGTTWKWENALSLCASTRNAEATVSCFEAEIRRNRTWQRSIATCKASGSGDAPTAPPIRVRNLLEIRNARAGMDTVVERNLNATLLSGVSAVSRPQVRAQITRNVLLSDRTAAASVKLPAAADRIKLSDFTFVEPRPPSEAGSREPTNEPANQPIELLAGLQLAPEVPLASSEIMQIYSSVYRDKNPESGIFYYFPRAYNVHWDKDAEIERGLGLRISYEQRSGGDTSNAVRMAVLLDARVDLQEVQIARELLRAQSSRLGFNFRDLRPFPLTAPPSVSLVDELQNRFNLSADQIAINALSSTLAQIELSWLTDPITAANMRLTLREGFGINGAAQFLPPNQDGPAPLIPVNIRIDNAETFGRFAFSRNAEMRNETPFNLKLERLHALVIENNNPVVHTWTLGNKTLPPAAKVEFDTTQLPSAVDSLAKLMWVSYAIDKSCASCIRDTIDGTVIGNVWPDTSTLVLRTLSPLAETGVRLLEVKTRSRFFDPDSRELKAGPVLIFERDNETKTIEPVFLTDRIPPDGGPEWPLFEYQVTAIMPSGEVVPGETWLPASGERVFIGSHQLRQSTGRFAEQ